MFKRFPLIQNVFHLFFVFTVCCDIVQSQNADHKIVETKNGKIRGIRQTTLLEKVDFYSFKGIPYAKKPTGELRYKPPEPMDSWSPSIRDAFEHGPVCIQPSIPNEKQSEDCLFLNIYVPVDIKRSQFFAANIKSDEKLAVFVHLHGGVYGVGSGNDYFNLGPDFLIEKGVIVVTLNYRLGVFGFISFGTAEYSGNMGLKDQQMALKWIHSNIEQFSGDPNRITLTGFSAGGSSTHFQMLSSESRKYFRNAILMSGSLDDYWTYTDKSDNLEFAYKIASDLGEPKKSVDELIAFFKSVPAEKMGEYGKLNGLLRRTFDADLLPVIERKDAIRPFLNDLPREIYNKSDVNIDAMFTLSDSEFITFHTKYAEEIYDLKCFDRNFSLILPFRGSSKLMFDSEKYQRLAKEIRTFYFGDAPVDESTVKQYIDLFSDVNFAYGIDKSARQHATKTNSKTFYVRFSVDSKLNVFKKSFGGGNMPGAGHGDDQCYVFRCEAARDAFDEILKNPNDKESKIALQTIEFMTKLLTNFVKYGDPTYGGDPITEFLPIQKDQVNFLDVTKDGLKLGTSPRREANELWSRIEQELK